MCEFVTTDKPTPDSGIPAPLRDAIKQRRMTAIRLHTAMMARGLTPSVFQLIDEVSDLNRSLRRREWLARVTGFDPIALGM